ncbi:MAG: hypothetical protein ACAH95_13435 [Fimbriimonas sp.]
MIWLPALCIAIQAQASLVAGYKADWSQASGSKDALKAFFGLSTLRLSPNGHFTLIGERMKGFWRRDGERIVLVFDGFFGHPFPIPDDLLKKATPSNSLHGLVLRIRSNNTLMLEQFGTVKGPVRFNKLPARPLHKLLELSNAVESEDDLPGMDAYQELADRLPTDWPALMDYIANRKNPLALRTWATYFFPNVPQTGLNQAVKLLDLPELRDFSSRQKSRLVRSLVGNLARSATPAVAAALLENEKTLRINASELADAIGNAGYEPGLPRLLELLVDKSEWTRSKCLDALRKLKAKPHLTTVLKSVGDSEPMVRVAAWAAVLDLSLDISQRRMAIHQLAKLFDSDTFVNDDILEALGRSHLPDGLPYLSNRLLNVNNPREQAVAARALGEIRLPAAAAALMQGKRLGEMAAPKSPVKMNEVEQAMQAHFSLEDTRKAIAEALWKYTTRRIR